VYKERQKRREETNGSTVPIKYEVLRSSRVVELIGTFDPWYRRLLKAGQELRHLWRQLYMSGWIMEWLYGQYTKRGHANLMVPVRLLLSDMPKQPDTQVVLVFVREPASGVLRGKTPLKPSPQETIYTLWIGTEDVGSNALLIRTGSRWWTSPRAW